MSQVPKKFTSSEAAKIQNKSPLTFKKSDQVAFFDVPDNTEPVSPTSFPCIVQIRLLDGSTQKAQFQSENTLEFIAEYILKTVKNSNEYEEGFALTVPFPKRIRYDKDGIKNTTLKAASLSPNGTVIVEKIQNNGWKREEKSKIADVTYKTFFLASDTKLRGQSHEEKQAFEERMRKKEIEEKEKEKRKKKQDLNRVRAMLKEREKSKTTSTTTTTIEEKKDIHVNAPKTYTDCLIRVQMHDGSKIDLTLPSNSTLSQVQLELKKQGRINSDLHFSFVTNAPRKVYNASSFNTLTLDAIGLVPKGVITVLPDALKGQLTKGTTPIQPAAQSDDHDYDY